MLFISLPKHAHLWWKTLLSPHPSPSSTKTLVFSTSVFSHFLCLSQSWYGFWNLSLMLFLRAVWASGLKSEASVNTGPQLSLYCSDQSPNLIQNLLYLPVFIANMSRSQKPHPKLLKACHTQDAQRKHNPSFRTLTLENKTLMWLHSTWVGKPRDKTSA